MEWYREGDDVDTRPRVVEPRDVVTYMETYPGLRMHEGLEQDQEEERFARDRMAQRVPELFAVQEVISPREGPDPEGRRRLARRHRILRPPSTIRTRLRPPTKPRPPTERERVKTTIRTRPHEPAKPTAPEQPRRHREDTRATDDRHEWFPQLSKTVRLYRGRRGVVIAVCSACFYDPFYYYAEWTIVAGDGSGDECAICLCYTRPTFEEAEDE